MESAVRCWQRALIESANQSELPAVLQRHHASTDGSVDSEVNIIRQHADPRSRHTLVPVSSSIEKRRFADRRMFGITCALSHRANLECCRASTREERCSSTTRARYDPNCYGDAHRWRAVRYPRVVDCSVNRNVLAPLSVVADRRGTATGTAMYFPTPCYVLSSHCVPAQSRECRIATNKPLFRQSA